VYPLCGIDKARGRGETWPVDPEMRDALDRLGADLSGEIRTSAEEGRAYVDGSIQASAAETRAYIDERLQASAAETRAYIHERLQATNERLDATNERLDATRAGLVHEIRESESRVRRHFEVVGESLRGDIRGVAELVALSSEASKRRDDELAERTDRLEGRVTRLEVRVKDLEDGREPRRG
jgi:polyhydroxyalkanoate synthesis regulator phasin